MRCQWQSYIKLLPHWLREPVDRLGKDTLTDLRLRLGQAPQLAFHSKSLWLERVITKEDINFCINAASQYSPWAAATVSHGYITAPGGHRLGICGTAVRQNGACTGFRSVTSLCIRVARDLPDLAGRLGKTDDSLLIIGAPGSGKTTLLRDVVRQRSDRGPGSISVLDERGELFPHEQGAPCFFPGRRTDILSGVPKSQGVVTLIRCMGPSAIAVDEITAPDDCAALLHAGWCGVKILATAHAMDKEDLYRREVYRPLIAGKLFDSLVILQQDKSWRLERMES